MQGEHEFNERIICAASLQATSRCMFVWLTLLIHLFAIGLGKVHLSNNEIPAMKSKLRACYFMKISFFAIKSDKFSI